MVKCAKVKRKDGETVRRKLAAENAIDNGYVIARDDDFVYFPLKENGVSAARKLKLTVSEKKALKRLPNVKSLSEALEGVLTEEEQGELITAHDVIGDIAILEIPESLEKKEKRIAEAMLRVNHNIKVVLKKAGAMEGEYRVRKFEHLAGEKRTETIHSENGCRFKIDISNAYFSPRLGFERKRISDLSLGRGKENVLVMFAGVGPFAINVGRRNHKAKVAAIELNPDAVRYMRENVILNKCPEIEVIEGDVREVVPKKFAKWADRVLMPLPKSAEEFLDIALVAARTGCIVHLYTFDREEEPFDKAIIRIKEEAKKAKRKITIENKRIVRPFAPHVVQIVIDFKMA